MDKDTVNQNLRTVSNELASYMHENVGKERTPVFMEVEKFGKRIVEKLRATFKNLSGDLTTQQPVPVKTAATIKEEDLKTGENKVEKKAVKSKKESKPTPGKEVDADTDEFN